MVRKIKITPTLTVDGRPGPNTAFPLLGAPDLRPSALFSHLQASYCPPEHIQCAPVFPDCPTVIALSTGVTGMDEQVANFLQDRGVGLAPGFQYKLLLNHFFIA